MKSTENFSDKIKQLKDKIIAADVILIGAGAGLSTAAGFDYTGERFHKYFSDFEAKYNFHDMYSGGLYPFSTTEEYWAYWSRYIFINRYQDAPKPVYSQLLEIISNKDYFVITTNVDHYFRKRALTKNDCFILRAITVCFSAVNPVDRKPLTMNPQSMKWLNNRKI